MIQAFRARRTPHKVKILNKVSTGSKNILVYQCKNNKQNCFILLNYIEQNPSPNELIITFSVVAENVVANEVASFI